MFHVKHFTIRSPIMINGTIGNSSFLSIFLDTIPKIELLTPIEIKNRPICSIGIKLAHPTKMIISATAMPLLKSQIKLPTVSMKNAENA